MLFNSVTFFLFFLTVLLLYFLLPHRKQNVLILVASATFYAAWDFRFLGLMYISILTDYVCGRVLGRTPKESTRKLFLSVSILINLGILFFFKYFNFFTASAERLLHAFGLAGWTHSLHIILPVGISFYTFQCMSYSIDVYRREQTPTKNFIDFAAYISFFPQLVAGPIERASALLPQFGTPRKVSSEQVSQGIWLICWGLFKKVVIADNLSTLVDPVFAWNTPLSGGLVLVSLYAFAFQIYCDFSGYSDMAKGLASVMGFKLMWNFKRPYFAVNPKEFWSRWHISPSTWLRDYVYISFGGNRHGTFKTYRNLLLTMLLGGLWHGAAWTFVFWGAYQGGILIVHRVLHALHPAIAHKTRPRWLTLLQWMAMFHIICLGWLLFRANSMSQVITFLSAIFLDFTWIPMATGHLLAFILLCAPLWLTEWCQEKHDNPLVFFRLPAPVQIGFGAAIITLLLAIANTGSQQFIYFQF